MVLQRGREGIAIVVLQRGRKGIAIMALERGRKGIAIVVTCDVVQDLERERERVCCIATCLSVCTFVYLAAKHALTKISKGIVKVCKEDVSVCNV